MLSAPKTARENLPVQLEKNPTHTNLRTFDVSLCLCAVLIHSSSWSQVATGHRLDRNVLLTRQVADRAIPGASRSMVNIGQWAQKVGTW